MPQQSHSAPSIGLVISALSAPGGAERTVVRLANFWAERGQTVTIITLQGPAIPFFELDPRVRRVPLDVIADSPNVAVAALRNLKRLRRIRNAITEAKADVVVSFVTVTNILVLIASLGSGVPVVVSERSVPGVEPAGWIWERLRRLVYRRAARIVVQSRTAAEYFTARLQQKILVIPNPIESAKVAHDDHRSEERYKLVAVGRLGVEKDFAALIEAFARVASHRPEWDLTIYGEGPLRPRLESRVRELELQNRVFLPGTAKDIPEKLARSDLFVLSSRFEGFPNALCEAMAAGLPVISTNCPGGAADIVRNGVDGILVAVGDVRELAAALDRLMGDPEERKRLGGRAQEVTSRFDLDSIMSMWDAAAAGAMNLS